MMVENKTKILVVEDDYDFRGMVRDFLLGNGLDVQTATNGKEAYSLLTSTKFGLVISDIKMPVMTGVELLKEIRNKNKKLPVILMTGFAHILETEEAHRLGANDFIAKPFPTNDLLELVKKYIKIAEPKDYIRKKPSSLPTDYFAIPIDDFLSGPVLKYDLYIKLGDSKFVRLADAGTQIDKYRIENYKSKGVETLFVTMEDYKKYLQLNVKLATSISSDPKYNKISSKLIRNINGILGDLVFKKALDTNVYNDTKEICTKTFELISDNSSLIEMLDSLSKISERELFHSTAVSFVASLVSRYMAWTYSPNVHKLVLASMLHDIGKRMIPENLLNRLPVTMSVNEIKEYEKHSTLGRDILLDIKNMPSDVMQAVYEHHESYNGTGFPNGVSGQQIHPLARIIKIADDFCNYLYQKEGGQSRSIDEACEIISTVKSVEYEPSTLQAFLKAFNKSK